MISKRYLIFALLLCVLCCNTVYAQFSLPTFDIDLKVNQTLVPGSGDNNGELEFVETTNVHGAAHVQINQYIAIGGYYSRSFRGNSAFRYNEGNIEQEAVQLQTGIDIRFSTSRAKNWRKYLVVNYGKIEMITVTETLRYADKTNAFGGSLGIMRRLSNNLYLTVIELGVKVMSDDIFWFNSTDSQVIMADAKIGLTYNIGKRK
jgi:hypothetical protein